MKFMYDDRIPLSNNALNFLKDTIRAVIETKSSTRKFIKSNREDGPSPILEKVDIGSKNSSDATLSYYNYARTAEGETTFSLTRDDVELLELGVESIDTNSMEEAVNSLIVTEESLVYNGNSEIGVKGILPSLSTSPIKVAHDPQSIIDGILLGAVELRHGYIGKPLVLVVGFDFLQFTSQIVGSKVLASLIEEELENEIIVSDILKGALLVQHNSGNLVMNRTKDMEVSFLYQDAKGYHFKINNAFSIQVLDERTAIPITLK